MMSFKSPGRRLSAYFVCGAMLALIPAEKLRRGLRGWMALVATAALILGSRAGGLFQIGPVALAVIMFWLIWHL